MEPQVDETQKPEPPKQPQSGILAYRKNLEAGLREQYQALRERRGKLVTELEVAERDLKWMADIAIASNLKLTEPGNE
jgi:hypothetical protein